MESFVDRLTDELLLDVIFRGKLVLVFFTLRFDGDDVSVVASLAGTTVLL